MGHWSKDKRYTAHARAAVEQNTKGDGHFWRSCFACEGIVGNYERDATAALARNMKRSPDTVEARARAAVTYHILLAHFRANPGVWRRVQQLRRELGYSHFAAAGRMLSRDATPLEVLAMLDTAATEGAGVKTMAGHTNGQAAIELPVQKLSDTSIYKLIEHHGREAAIVVLPGTFEDYQGKTAKVQTHDH